MLYELEDLPVTVRKFVPGEDHTDELEAVSRSMTSIRDEYDLGFYDYDGGQEDYRERLAALVEKRRQLEALPKREARYIEEPTGETYAESYQRMDQEERRNLLMNAGIRLELKPGPNQNSPQSNFHVPDKLYTVLSLSPEEVHAKREAQAAAFWAEIEQGRTRT
ncbi:hypothetical protein [Nocardia sp. NPDC002869]|uniref:hypothetical protein n=1 Tax=Nocardia sp. NPDC002869 TaxID=3161032 RepID=UPI00398D3C92